MPEDIGSLLVLFIKLIFFFFFLIHGGQVALLRRRDDVGQGLITYRMFLSTICLLVVILMNQVWPPKWAQETQNPILVEGYVPQ